MMKTLQKILSVLCLLGLLLSLGACGNETPATTAAPQPTAAATTAAPQPAATTKADEQPAQTTAPADDKPEAALQGPVMVISVGKSADISVAKSIMTRLKLEYTVYEDGTELDLTGYKSVMIVPGVSTKGLGDAGIDVKDELSATAALLEKIKAADVKVLVAHLGGSSRRDELTDQFIDAVLPAADQIVVLDEGNKDGKFTDFASANNIPCSVSADITALVAAVQALYGK